MKPIEDIEVGDEVLAYDHETGEQAYKPVVRLFRNTTDKWYHVHVNEQDITCTAEHPFYVADLETFVPTKDLKAGQRVLLADGSCAVVDGILVEELNAPETTYNFEVEDFHTYYVSSDKVLVHNKCGELVNNPLEDIKYSDKVMKQMDMGDNHSFPLEVDNFGALGKITKIIGADGKTYTKLTIDGVYKGSEGVFEYIYNAAKECNHRFFRRSL